MKLKLLLILLFSVFVTTEQKANLPDGFVYVQELAPDIQVELRYYSSHNFVGDTIAGYKSNKLILTKAAAQALAQANDELLLQNKCFLVYDGYRPQRAVNQFIEWARDLNDTIKKAEFYPYVDKKDLFKEEYIATRSGHSKGSTVDLTIIDGETNKPLDMGSPFDFFAVQSWIDYDAISEEQKANRQLLQNVMLKYGFRNYPREWWHFTLRNEPFPSTYFDFEVE
ncbi:MAG: M15 family metallopeptidase [Mangrovimonas sp.]|nr:M15 family metallopeptidase [Mangrovimonas sp.]